MEPYAISALVTLVTSLFIFRLAYQTGMTRQAHKAPPHKHTDNHEVLIANRIHMNTVEMSVVYLPILWVATVFASANLAGLLGIVWFISRVGYAFAYRDKPKKRETPFMIGVVCIGLTALLAVYGIFT